MPCIVTKRGKNRWKAVVRVKEVRREKLFGSADNKKEYREAVKWEEAMRVQILEELEKLKETETVTVSTTILDWANQYLDFGQQRFSKGTFNEKRECFLRLFGDIPKDKLINELTIQDGLRILSKQAKQRSGNAANKDRLVAGE
jgi:hypothetical protein